MSNNDNRYMGIAKATVQYNTDGVDALNDRIIELSYFYPVCYSEDINYYVTGPKSIVYDMQGTVSHFSDEPFKLYSKYVDSGKKDSAGNIIFDENVEVKEQKWSIVYYDNKGNLVTSNDDDVNKSVLAYMPTLKADNTIIPAPMYFEYTNGNFYVPVVICTSGKDEDGKDKVVWS
jgi:hypothetical protein